MKVQTEKIGKRTARANGHSGIICIPARCIGQTYERYMDTETGIITLVPYAKEHRVTDHEKTVCCDEEVTE